MCWECFAYDRGRKLPLRDQVHGFTFCSGECEASLKQRYDRVCLQAWAAVEKASKSKSKTEGDEADGDADAKPAAAEIDEAWTAAAATAASIAEGRARGPQAAKAHKRALQQALSDSPPVDVLTFQTHAILTRYMSPGKWSAILSLADEPRPYASKQELRDHIRAYLRLAATLPQEVLPLVTPDTLRTAKSREVHNSFGIRSLGDEGSEFFGFGVWPSASYLNHSCAPNVRRRRVGRTWVFEAKGDVPAGRELYMSYLNGEEETLTAAERKARLRKTWGFDCACAVCRAG